MCRSLATVATYMLDPCAEQTLLPHEFELLKLMRSIADLPASAQTNETATTPAPDARSPSDKGVVRHAAKSFDDWYDSLNGSKREDLTAADIARWILNFIPPEWGWGEDVVAAQVRGLKPEMRCLNVSRGRGSSADQAARRGFCNQAPNPFDGDEGLALFNKVRSQQKMANE